MVASLAMLLVNDIKLAHAVLLGSTRLPIWEFARRSLLHSEGCNTAYGGRTETTGAVVRMATGVPVITDGFK